MNKYSMLRIYRFVCLLLYLESEFLEKEFDVGGLVVWSLDFWKSNVSFLKVKFQLLLGFLLLVSSFKGFIGDDAFQIELTADLVSTQWF